MPIAEILLAPVRFGGAALNSTGSLGGSALVDAAASGIIRSAFGLSGQKCSACRRVIVERPVANKLLEKLVAGAAALKVGDPIDPATNLGPVIDKAIANRIDAALAQAKKDGKVYKGGHTSGLDGYYFNPVIVGDLPTNHPLTREELFAPFLTVTVVDSFEKAIKEANAVHYGLSAGVYACLGMPEARNQSYPAVMSGAPLTGPPAACSWSPERLDVFARGPRGELMHKAWNGKDWAPFTSLWMPTREQKGEILPVPFTGVLAACSSGPGRLDVFATALDGNLYQTSREDLDQDRREEIAHNAAAPVA